MKERKKKERKNKEKTKVRKKDWESFQERNQISESFFLGFQLYKLRETGDMHTSTTDGCIPW